LAEIELENGNSANSLIWANIIYLDAHIEGNDDPPKDCRQETELDDGTL